MERIRENIQIIQQTMQHNRELINKMRNQLRQSSVASDELRRTLDNLTRQMKATSIMAPMAKTIIFFIILVFCLITYFILYISVLLSCGLACQDYDKLATWVVLLKMGNDFCQSATHTLFVYFANLTTSTNLTIGSHHLCQLLESFQYTVG